MEYVRLSKSRGFKYACNSHLSYSLFFSYCLQLSTSGLLLLLLLLFLLLLFIVLLLIDIIKA